MLELQKFGHMTTSTIKFESRDKMLLGTPYTEVITSQTLFQNTLALRWHRVVIFANIIKIVTILIKTIFKDSKKVKRIRSYASKCDLYICVF